MRKLATWFALLAVILASCGTPQEKEETKNAEAIPQATQQASMSEEESLFLFHQVFDVEIEQAQKEVPADIGFELTDRRDDKIFAVMVDTKNHSLIGNHYYVMDETAQAAYVYEQETGLRKKTIPITKNQRTYGKNHWVAVTDTDQYVASFHFKAKEKAYLVINQISLQTGETKEIKVPLQHKENQLYLFSTKKGKGTVLLEEKLIKMNILFGEKEIKLDLLKSEG